MIVVGEAFRVADFFCIAVNHETVLRFLYAWRKLVILDGDGVQPVRFFDTKLTRVSNYRIAISEKRRHRKDRDFVN